MNDDEARERLGPGCRSVRLIQRGPIVREFALPDGPPREVEEILDAWTEAGRWWEGEREAAFFRFRLAGPVIVELMRDGEGGWWLVRILD